MIRHLAELSALLLCFAVGVGILTALVIGLLMIWRPEFTTTAGEDEYRRVESEGRAPLSDTWMGFPVEYNDALPVGVIVIKQPRPYNWATREPYGVAVTSERDYGW